MRSMIVTGLIVVVLTSAPARVIAQQAALEEIVVTATRREERLQDVATSATVFSGEDLQALRVLEPQDLAEQTPGLLAKYGPNGLATVGFYMRGVGINDFTGTVDPSVGVYVDEVFQPTPDMLNFAVYDIERVEVLRGPQGTLYGRNSTGGAINFITARPTKEFEGYARAGYGSFDTFTASGALSGPLSEHAARAPVGERDQRLEQRRLLVQPLHQQRPRQERVDRGARAARNGSRARTSACASCTTTAIQSRSRPCCSTSARATRATPPPSARPSSPGASTRVPAWICSAIPIMTAMSTTARRASILSSSLRSDDVTLTIDWNIGNATLTSISGYADFSKRQSQDIDASPNVAADNFTFNDVENFSQEIRLTSDDSFRWPWIVGANYGKTDIDWFQTIDLTALAIPTSNGAVQSTEAWAVFGNLTIPLSETFDFVAGLRFTNETRDWTGATFVGTFGNLDEASRAARPGCRSCRCRTATRGRAVRSTSRPASMRTRSTSRPCSATTRTTTRCTTPASARRFAAAATPPR